MPKPPPPPPGPLDLAQLAYLQIRHLIYAEVAKEQETDRLEAACIAGFLAGWRFALLQNRYPSEN
jgi:hypothetical protein